MDINESGKIYWNEFLAATISQAIFMKEENLLEAFNNFDKERKGYFNLSDLRVALSSSNYDYDNEEDFEMIFKEAFPTGKTQIYYKDFKKMMEYLSN